MFPELTYNILLSIHDIDAVSQSLKPVCTLTYCLSVQIIDRLDRILPLAELHSQFIDAGGIICQSEEGDGLRTGRLVEGVVDIVV